MIAWIDVIDVMQSSDAIMRCDALDAMQCDAIDVMQCDVVDAI